MARRQATKMPVKWQTYRIAFAGRTHWNYEKLCDIEMLVSNALYCHIYFIILLIHIFQKQFTKIKMYFE